MMRLVTCICVLTIGASCIPDESSRRSAEPVGKTDVLVVFLTGNELGELKPCGCVGGQLGGLERRAAIFKSVPASKRLIVDTGSLVEETGEQDLIKFEIIVQAFHLLNYDLVNLSEKDIEIAKNLGVLSNLIVGFISAHDQDGERLSAKFANQFLLKGKPVVVAVAAFDVESAPVEQIGKLFTSKPGLQTVNILILNRCDAGIIASVAEMGGVDCLVCPAESDEAMMISEPNERPLVVSVGRYGRYVGKLEIRAGAPGEVGDKLYLNFSAVDVNESLRPESSLVELYEDYQRLVKDANLLEKQRRWPLTNGLEYTGSESCKYCHGYEYEKWSSKAHAHAYATLEKVGSQYDPECVVCHVVGAEYESGFVSEEKSSEDLKNIGCENCHGPGSEHIRTLGVVETSGPKLDCSDCHTPENSANYAGNEQLYFEKIIHWREPNSDHNVKDKGESKD